MILLDLFSGIGGFAKAIENCDIEITKHYFSEIDKHAIACYKHNFKNAEHIGSVADIRGSDLKRPNVITFGSPCQDFSLAGKRAGMDGERSSLIGEAIRLIGECRPDIFIWENVKGVFSSGAGSDFWAIIQAFANIGGYRLEWQLLNTAWVLPQNRERLYLVGHLAESRRDFRGVFPIGESDFRANERAVKTSITRTLTAGGNSGGLHSSMTLIRQINDKKNLGGVSTKQQDRVYDSTGIMACLSSSRTESKVNIVVKNRGHGYFKGSESESKTPTLNAKSSKDNISVHQDGKIRRLTEIECERLQGFPDNWTQFGNYDGIVKKIPKTHRYKMCGNAVTAKVVELVVKKLV